MKKIIYIVLAYSFSLTSLAQASPVISTDSEYKTTKSHIFHSGRTDKTGCHNDRKNGGRHCH